MDEREIELTEDEQDLFDRVEECCQEDAVGAALAGIPGLPPLIEKLVRRYAGESLCAAVNSERVDDLLPRGAGKTNAPGFQQDLARADARGGKWRFVAILEGPNQ